jgi:osmotically-inducible protein OsmY
MKTPSIITIISTLTLAAGCAHHERYASYDDSISSPAYGTTTYNSSQTYHNSGSASTSPDISAGTSANGAYGSQPGSPDYSASGSIWAAGDQNLTAQVQQSIYNDNTLVTIAPQIHVMARSGGTVVLSGKVPNNEQKQSIEQRVKQVAGVVNVRNNIQVGLDPTGRTGSSSHIYSNSISGAQTSVGAAQSDGGGQIVGGASSQVSPDSASGAAVSGQVDLQNKSWESKQLKPTSNSSANRQYGKDQSVVPAASPSQSDQASRGAVEDKYAAPSANNNQSSATGDAAAPSATVSGSKSAAINSALNSQAAQTPGASTSPRTSQSDVGTLPGATQSGSAAVSDTRDAKGGVGDSSAGSLNGQTSVTGSTGASSEGKGSTSDRSPSSLSGASTGSSSGISSGSKEGVSVQVQGTTDSDRALGQQITQQLRADSDLSAALPMLRIKIENGKATLRGNVKSEDQKKKVESTVQQVTGVSSVENQLRVGASTSSATNP